MVCEKTIMLDLKNTFGEVNQNLIHEVLHFHHIPDHIKSLVQSFCFKCFTSVIASEYETPLITVSSGVLQGDCLSLLLFKMCFNTLFQHIKCEKYRQVGFFEKNNLMFYILPIGFNLQTMLLANGLTWSSV